jgi:hypothetical protein
MWYGRFTGWDYTLDRGVTGHKQSDEKEDKTAGILPSHALGPLVKDAKV